MTMRFREEKAKGHRNRKSTAIAISTVGMALLLATVTTGIGFMSNTISSLSILKDFAIMVTIGIISSFIIMTTFQPAVKMVLTQRRERKKGIKPTKKDHQKKKKMGLGVKIVTSGARAGDKSPGAVLAIVLVFSLLAGYAGTMVETVFDFYDFLPEDTEAHDNIVFMMEEFTFGEQESGDFYIKGDMTNPAVLVAMDQCIKNTADDEQVLPGTEPRSILSVMQKYANPLSTSEYIESFVQTWAVSDTNGDGLPEQNVKDLYDILLYSTISHDELIGVLHHEESGDYTAGLIQVRVTSDNLRKAQELRDELNEDAKPLKELEKDGVIDKVYVIGGPIVTDVVIDELNAGQIRSIIITVIASTIVLTIVFYILERSFILGFLTSIPIMLVILWIIGSMYVLDYDLNVMTITIASLTVGMGITYAIHVTERFTEDLKIFEDIGQACENTLTHTGMALAGAFMTTAGGFGVLFFHSLPPLQQFGTLIALSITYSFLASTFILPTFLIMWAKWRRKRQRK
jgi:predicted RND superfamily exporter protein